MANELPSSTKWKKMKAECRQKGKLYEDPDFAADYLSIDANMPEDIRPYIIWRRPHELHEKPRMFTGGAGREDIKQGTLGNCWFLASLASLTMSPKSLEKVVPKDQDFTDKDYAGCFRFNFWQYGRWKQIIIDDRLPTYNGRLIFTHSVDDDEFWTALVEKAYAKVFGSYVALKGGQISEALVDFTGGIGEDINLKDKLRLPEDLYSIAKKAFEEESLMGCAIKPLEKPGDKKKEGDEEEEEDEEEKKEGADPTKANAAEDVLSCGLVAGHAYSITNVAEVSRSLPDGVDPRPEVGSVSGSTKTERLLRIRNPWGNDTEWNGAWGDDSSEWETVSKEEKDRVEYTEEDDGEFWINFEDFLANFDNLTICHNTDSNEERINFGLTEFDGQWTRGMTDGGCRNHLQTFPHNNQYRLQLEDSEEDGDGKCTIVCSLMQKNYRGAGKQRLTIGFSLYKIEDDGLEMDKLSSDYFALHKAACKPLYMNTREVVLRADVDPGLYAIIPTTFEQGKEGLYYMRIMTEQPAETQTMEAVFQADVNTNREITPEDQEMVKNITEMYVKESEGMGFIGAGGIERIFTEIFPNMKPNRDCIWALISFFDEDRSGKIDDKEFIQMWKFYDDASKIIHEKFDHNQSASIDAQDLQPCLSALGIVISVEIASKALQRYEDEQHCVSCNDVIVIAGKIHATHTVGDELKLDKKAQEIMMGLSFSM